MIAAGQSSPKAAEPSNDHSFIRKDEPPRPDGRIEVGPGPEKQGGDRAKGERQTHGDAKNSAVGYAHQLRRRRIIRDRAKGAANQRWRKGAGSEGI